MMDDIVAINRLILIFARNAINRKEASLLTGIPQDVLEKLATLDVAKVESLARNMPLSLLAMRLDAEEIDKILMMPDTARPAYAISVVTNKQKKAVGARRSRTVAS